MKFITLNQLPLYTDDFFFHFLDDIQSRDAIVICNPCDAIVISPVLLRSRKSLDEHIEHIRKHNIKKAIVVAENIEFLRRCPSLEYLWVLPALSAQDFDYSPLYDLPNIKWLQCRTIYGPDEDRVTSIDYSRIRGLKRLAVCGKHGHMNVASAGEVIALFFDFGYPDSKDLHNTLPGSSIKKLVINQSPVYSLDGIEAAAELSVLELAYNRRLKDISALSAMKDSLRWLSIENCGKIKDFSVLSEFYNMQRLELKGSNIIPDLSFIRKMPHLKSLILTMNVADGDLKLCEQIPYVRIRNRKHYSHKDSDFTKMRFDDSEVKRSFSSF